MLSALAITPEPVRSSLLRGTRLRNHVLHLFHQSWAMVRNPVLDGPLDAAGANRLPVLDLIYARGIEHLEVLERIAVHDDQIGTIALTNAAELILLAEDAGV